jgi:PLP dependent protein
MERILPVLLEVNVSGEASKSGLAAEAMWEAVPAIVACDRLRLEGLMTVAPLAATPEEARPVFRGLASLRRGLAERFPEQRWAHLSMGMTDDFEVAVEEGATLVRIGRAIFGPRPT